MTQIKSIVLAIHRPSTFKYAPFRGERMGDPDKNLFGPMLGKEMSFRFRGPMNWLGFYRGTLSFWKERRWEVYVPKYKDKTSEFECKMRVEIEIDMYTKAIVEMEMKAENMRPIEGKPGWYTGAMFIYCNPQLEYNYDKKSPLGKRVLFEDKSWLDKLFRKVVQNEIDEEYWGVPVITTQQYIDWIRTLFGTEAHHV
jgi:hypothetical protein